MKKVLMFLLLYSCSTAQRERAPAWVEGVRDGSESLKVVNGSKILFRRVLPQGDLTEQETCEKAMSLVSSDLKNEFLIETKIPYTLEYLYFDEDKKYCAVTISISSQISSRLEEIKEIKKNHKMIEKELKTRWGEAIAEKRALEEKHRQLKEYLSKNAHLLAGLNRQIARVNSIQSMLRDRQNKAAAMAFTGLRVGEFESAIGEDVSIQWDLDTICRIDYGTTNYSRHGVISVCWDEGNRGAVIMGFCDNTTNKCWKRNP